MTSLAKEVYNVSNEDIKKVKEHYNLDDEEIKKNCCVIEEWMKEQAHFPDDFDATRVECFLLRNKFRVEQTKRKLENYYTVRGKNVDFFKSMDPLDEDMERFLTSGYIIPMPRLLNSTERMYVQRLTGNDKNYILKQNALMSFALSELELKYDYAVGIRIIVDCDGVGWTHLKSISDIHLLARVVYMYQECLSGRILGLHFINAPGTICFFLDILKIAFPEKLYKRIIMHKKLDSLKEIIPEEYLPSDYGGKNKSNDQIFADVKKLLLEERDYLLQRINVVSDESKRVVEVKKVGWFGGSFKWFFR